MPEIKASKILSIRKNGHKKPVYDIQVKNNHNFIANGHVVHNCIFQEQIQEISIKLAGFSDDDADRLRKAILKRTVKDIGKAKSLTEQLEEKFVEGAVANGYAREKAQALYEDLRNFAKYGFNKSHSVAYAYISYQCAYLAAYYEAEWLCSYVESMLGDPESRRAAVSEIKALGYRVAPVDINRSGLDWEVSEDGSTFYPSFLTVTGVGAKAVEEIVRERPYRDVEDLLWRPDGEWKHSKFNVKIVDALCKVGAFSDVVGYGKRLDNHRQLHHVLTSDVGGLKKRLKRDPDRYKRRLDELVDEAKRKEEWPRSEVVRNHVELVGSVDDETLLDPEVRRMLDEHGIGSVDTLSEGDEASCWFVLSEAVKKVSRNGRPYFQLAVYGSGGAQRRVYIWSTGTKETSLLKPYVCYLASRMKRDSFGLSCRLGDLREVE